MTELLVSEFASVVHGEVQGLVPNAKFCGFALDNREVKPGEMFVAVIGSRVDGHVFAASAVKAGASVVLAEKPVAAPHVLVKNVVQALADFASHIRESFNGPVIGITGSAGKTTTKELTAAALAPLGPILKTEGNRNSEFSSPLLWGDLTKDHCAVVVEMGMRGFGQIEHLASFSKPTIGVVTNIGYSHIELVGNRDGVAQAKAELLTSLPVEGHAVLWAEDPYLARLSASSKAKVSTFGTSPSADCRITSYHALDWKSCEFEGEAFGETFSAKVPAVGRHIALNASAAILVAQLCGVNLGEAARAVGKAVLPPMRMEVVEHNGATILLDTYNASPTSVIAALETVNDMPVTGRRIAVLGDMRELGTYSEEGHREVGRALASMNFDLAVLVGESARWIGEAAIAHGYSESQVRWEAEVADVSEVLRELRPGDAVLIKGSRALELERALDFLKEPAK